MIPPIATGGRAIYPAIAELGAIPRWVCWKLEQRNGKLSKVPYTIGGRRRASSTDQSTWDTFDACWASAFANGAATGIGIVLDGSDDLLAADLDHCIGEDGALSHQAQAIVAKLDSYTERSPSGTGLRVFFRGAMADKGRKVAHLELYRAERYLTVTGDHLDGTPETINTVAPEIIAELLGPATKPTGQAGDADFHVGDHVPDELRERLEDAMAGDARVRAAWDGAPPDRNDQSRSAYDLKLAGALRRHGGFSLSDFATLARFWPYGKGRDGDPRHWRRTWERAEPGEETEKATRAPILAAGNIGVQKVTWLWYPRIPAGQISLLGAPGGGGKGLNGAEYAACVTTGRNWPGSSDAPGLGHVLWCETEDPLAEVVVPRLIAAGADLSRIDFASRQAFYDLGDGLPDFIKERRTKLLLMSPMVSFLKGLSDINGEMGVREVLERLQAAIDGTGCAILGLAHTNKKADLRAIERLLGSVAFGNFVRSVLLVGRDREDPEWFRLVHGKHNLSIKGDDLLYRPKHIGQDPRDQFVKLEWRTPGDNIDPDSLFDRQRSNGASAGPSAGQWLVTYLEEHGESLRADVVIAAEKDGHTESAVRQAQQRNPRVQSRQEGFQGPYMWWLG